MVDKVPKEILEKIKTNNQTHLLEALKKCSTPKEQDDFIAQLKTIDFDLMASLYKLSKNENKTKTFTEASISKIESQYPIESISNEIENLSKIGYEYVAQGKVATLILSGGLGTRLGFDHPKGKFNIGMPSNKTLFNYLANRFLGSQNMCQEKLKDRKDIKFKDSLLLIMTSIHNDSEVREFFKEKKYFGIKEENVIFFSQGDICALESDTGNILLEKPNKIFKAADGNGGCLLALKNHGIIDICLKRGIEFINITAIDNPLYKIMDPLFIGLTVSKGKNGKDQMAAKYIKKTDPEQKVGNFLIYNGKPMMLDYMEVPEKIKYEKLDNGDYAYNAANILDYLISVNFLKSFLLNEQNLKKLYESFHHVKKKMECALYNKNKNDFEEKNIDFSKFELFFNSIFEFANKDGLLLLEINEQDEFAPVKNDASKDKCTAATARLQMSNLCKKWYKENKGELINDSNKKYLEFSFLLSYDGSDLFKNSEIPKKIDLKDVKEGEGLYFKNNKLE